MYVQLYAPAAPIVRAVLLIVTHVVRRFFCTVSLTLLPARLVGVTLPFAVTRLPSLIAPFVRPVSLSVTVGVNTSAVTVKLVALVPVPAAVVTAMGPLLAPAGTVAVSREAEATLKLAAAVPLKATLVAPLKPLPVTGHGRAHRAGGRSEARDRGREDEGVGGAQLGLLSPDAGRARERVGGAGVGLPGDVAVRRPDQGRVAGEGDSAAEPVVGGAVAGAQLGLLRPEAGGARKDVGGAGVGLPRDVVARRRDQGGLAGEGDRPAEPVADGAVGGDQLGLLRPSAGGAREHVGGAGVVAAVSRRPDQGRVAGEGDRVAEVVVGSAVAGAQLGLLRPDAG